MPQRSTARDAHPAASLFSQKNRRRADASVSEVFRTMFGLSVNALDHLAPDPVAHSFPGPDAVACPPGERTAIVGFSGAMRGACQIRLSAQAAESIASAMLGGVAFDEKAASLNDAVGELCNMLAGSWKNAVPGLSGRCTLSPPTVIIGGNYRVHRARPGLILDRAYQFGQHCLHLTLSCEAAHQP